MNISLFLKTAALISGMVILAGCASTTTAPTSTTAKTENMTKAQLAKDTADKLSGAKNVTTSADGDMICKRQEIAGSRFKRKICMTADEWEDLTEKNRKAAQNLNRRSSQQTRGN